MNVIKKLIRIIFGWFGRKKETSIVLDSLPDSVTAGEKVTLTLGNKRPAFKEGFVIAKRKIGRKRDRRENGKLIRGRNLYYWIQHKIEDREGKRIRFNLYTYKMNWIDSGSFV